MLTLLTILALLVVVQSQFANTINMRTQQDMDHIWLEIGYISLNMNTWTEITTTVVNFNQNDDTPMSAFFSLPEYGNASFQYSFPIVPRMNGPPYRNVDGSYSFQGILVTPDDDECSDEWWIPEDPGTLEVPWLIAEQGVYNLSHRMFLVQQGNMTRNNSNPVSSDTPHLYHHTVVFNYSTGCNPLDPDEPCTFPEHPNDGSLDSETKYFPWIKTASLQQIQSNNRKAYKNSVEKELFMSVRGRRIFTDRAQYLIATHSVDTSLYPNYEDVHTPELIAFLIFEKSVRLRCTEGLVIETQIFYTLTSNPLTFNYETVFDFPPGLFAMLGSLNSVGDSTILRSFDRLVGSSRFITQEDQCVDWEQEHTTKESAFAFVVGQSEDDGGGSTIPVLNCFAVFKNNLPTSAPSGQPSNYPSGEPSGVPSGEPSIAPSGAPSGEPSGVPSGEPSGVPSGEPSNYPSGEPSNYPSGEPSNYPSGEPSIAPSGAPSGAPAGEPSRHPSSCPSADPTLFPTPFPTFLPSLSPTSHPTLFPTSVPTGDGANCTFEFLLVDLFGDGYYTTLVNFTTTRPKDLNSTSEFHQPNCTKKVVSIFSETCSIDVSMLTSDGRDPLLTWESFWILNFKGETYIGDYFSKLSIVKGEVEFTENLVDYSVPGKGVNKCHECPHPPKHNANIPPGVCDNSPTAKPCPPPEPLSPKREHGKGDADDKHSGGPGKGGDDEMSLNSTDDRWNVGKDDSKHSDDDRKGSVDDMPRNSTNDHIHHPHGKPKPKPKPPYLVYLNMYDELSNGYLDKSGDWSDYYNTQDLVGNGLSAPIRVPNILAYPKYYLMTKDRRKLIKPPKSICAQNRGTEFCQEALPWNGHFIFRFAGIEPTDPADAATWEFCGMSGGINEEFEFLMQEGVCYPLTNKLSAEAYCLHGFETAINMHGAFTVSGNFGSASSLSELDTSILEKELALMMPGRPSVTITSVLYDDSSFNVYFKASVIAESMGYDGSQVDKVETMMYELESTMGEIFRSGSMKSKVINDLDSVANTENDPLRHAQLYEMLGNMEIDGVIFQDAQVGVNIHTGEIGGSWNSPENIDFVLSRGDDEHLELSETTSVVSLVVVVMGAIISILVATTVVKQRNGETVNFGLPDFGTEQEHAPLPVDSEHAVETNTQLEEESTHTIVVPKSKLAVLDFTLSSIEEGHKAVHYEDDIDVALSNNSKQHYEENVARKRSYI